ncbi:hypothetical protein [Hoyosella subflava]|uniref:hypothetical protein n=1 Tax=Hoyosella subflava TaxID=639313 RepID=UPI00059CF645|nr:hypothetical protein [Hoyosella subflava]
MAAVRLDTICSALRIPHDFVRRAVSSAPLHAETFATHWLGQRLDPLDAPFATYWGKYGSRIIVVHGPQRVYPSGLKYYFSDELGSRYVFSGDLDWIATPLMTRAAETTQQWATQSRQMFSNLRRNTSEAHRRAAA